MIAEFLDRPYIVAEMRAQRDRNAALLQEVRAGDPHAQQLLRKHGITPEQLNYAVEMLTAGLDQIEAQGEDESASAFIPQNVAACVFQSGLTELTISRGRVESTASPATEMAPPALARAAIPRLTEDVGPRLRISRSASDASPEESLESPFVEGEDVRYGLDGFWAKLGGLFNRRHPFNASPAQPAISGQPMRVFILGDWGTGLPLAQKVGEQIRRQLLAGDGSRQDHVVHLGDVYYTGQPREYLDRMLGSSLWPVQPSQLNQVGSWSLNGNHDMYSGGDGYFETLLRDRRFLRWHGDAQGNPSSFFLIEDPYWQIFGLDTSWNLPSLADVLGPATLKDYGGQNGILTSEQVEWMAQVRNKGKGLILLTHHQPASSRTTEKQHSRQAVTLLTEKGMYAQLDGWIWGHEHRGVLFKPKTQRIDPDLREAPDFCACVGHGGVPVPAKNFDAGHRKPDVSWEEDQLDDDAPLYEGQPVVPSGFACLESESGQMTFTMFDHRGNVRKTHTILRTASLLPAATGADRETASMAAETTARPNNAKIPPGYGDPIDHPKTAPRYYPLPPRPAPDNVEPGRELCVDLDWIAPGQGAVVAAQERLCFHAVGDTGNDGGNHTQHRIAEAMQRQVAHPPGGAKPRFFYHLGDVVYAKGAADVYDARFYEPYKEYDPPIVAIAGNHDAIGSTNQDSSRLDGWILNFMGRRPKEDWYPHRPPQSLPYVYWELATGVAHIFGLYSNIDGLLDPLDGPGTQAAWLTKRLRRVPHDRAIVIAVHHPPYSLAKSHGGCEPVGDALDKCSREAQRWPDLVLSGHVHSYQRFTRRVLDFGPDGGIREIPYVVAGAGGRAENPADIDGLRRWEGQPSIATPFVTRPREAALDLTLSGLDTGDPGFLLIDITRTSILCRAYRVPFNMEQATDWQDGFTLDRQNHQITNL